jgi:hypothetical protein
MLVDPLEPGEDTIVSKTHPTRHPMVGRVGDLASASHRERVTTLFLFDDGTVSRAQGTSGKEMHEGLPGHSFVLVDTNGQQRWYGEYPSMWLAPKDLLAEVSSRLGR